MYHGHGYCIFLSDIGISRVHAGCRHAATTTARHSPAKITFLWKPVFDLQTSCNKLNYRLCEGSVAVWLLQTWRHLLRLSYKICSCRCLRPGSRGAVGSEPVKFRITRFNDCMTSPGTTRPKNTLNSTFWLLLYHNRGNWGESDGRMIFYNPTQYFRYL